MTTTTHEAEARPVASARRAIQPVAQLRDLLGAAIRHALGSAKGELGVYASPDGDAGLFGPDSIAWVVHADLPVMLVGGFSALMLQTLHPLAMAGVADHSRFREDPLGRLHRTARFVAGTTFGPMPFVERLIAEVRAVHDRVHGTAPDGRPYSAHDPDLLRFVHVTEVSSFLRSYQRYSTRPLLRGEKDRYLAEIAEVARRLGATDVPQSTTEVRDYLRDIRPSLCATPAALEAVRFLRRPLGGPLIERGAQRLVTEAAIDLLPGFARRMLGFHEVPVLTPALARPATTSFALALRWATSPSPVVEISRARVARGRLNV